MSIIGLNRVETTGNLTGDLPDGHPILEDINFMQDKFGGAIPFEILIDYKEKSRLNKKSTWYSIEEIQNRFDKDTLFSRSISYVDAMKAANMAYFDNDTSQFKIITKKQHLRTLNKYLDSSYISEAKGVGFSITELVDTSNHILRIRCQMKDLGSYEVSDKADDLRLMLDSILNPERPNIEKLYTKFSKGNKFQYVDSIISSYNGVANALSEKYISNEDERLAYDMNPEEFLKSKYTNAYRAMSARQELKNTVTRGASKGFGQMVSIAPFKYLSNGNHGMARFSNKSNLGCEAHCTA